LEIFAPNSTGSNRLHEGELHIPRDCCGLLNFFKDRGLTAPPPQSLSFQNCRSRDIQQSTLSFLGCIGSFQIHVIGTYNIMRSNIYFTKFWMIWQNLCWVPITSSNGNWWDLHSSHLLHGLVLPMAITWYDNTFCFARSRGYTILQSMILSRTRWTILLCSWDAEESGI
jgi:hypothetical protein